MAKRTTHRSAKGTKLYAVRDDQGRFDDIQTYKRAHGSDVKRKSVPEGQAAAKTKTAEKAKKAKAAKKVKTAKKAKKAKKR